MRYSMFQNNKIYIIVDTDDKAFVAEVYSEEMAKKITDSLNDVLKFEQYHSIPPEPIVSTLSTEKESVETDNNQDQEDGPDFWKTGIKMKGGVEHYKCFYKCFNCGEQGKHYIPKNVSTIFCHKCDFELPVTTATKEGFPNRDEFGNYFVSKANLSGNDHKVVKTWRSVDKGNNFLS